MDTNKILQSDYLDILYGNRNKKYGSYQLRKNYQARAAKAFGIVFGVLILAIGSPLLLQEAFAKDADSIIADSRGREVITEIHDIKKPVRASEELKQDKANPQKSAPPKRAATLQHTVPKIVANNVVTPAVKPPDLSQLNNAVAGPVTFEGEGGNEVATNTKPHDGPFGNGADSIGADVVSTVVTEEPISFSEYPPEFPGGLSALYAYLRKNVKYPPQAAETGIKGKVIIKFVVNGNGEIEDAKVMRGIGGGCDKEALRVVNNMPKWNPGRHNGRTVKVYYTLPIDFRLD